MTANPGSDEALAKGCTCPMLDNAHGRRCDGNFVMSLDCTAQDSPSRVG